MCEENFLIKLDNVSFTYRDLNVIEDVSVRVKDGEFLAVLGKNGSGKSTFLKLVNALLLPAKGEVYVNEFSTKDKESVYTIRSTVGLVLQDPDNQIVNSIVEEDVAFGPENLGIPQEEIQKRVTEALQLVKMEKYAKTAISELSGGQKQRVAIAGVLAMKPKCLLLDEITAMLDAESKRGILEIIKNINKKSKTTIIMVTHDEEEIVLANRVLIFDKGKILLDSTPKNVLYDNEILKICNIKKPKIAEIIKKLEKRGINISTRIISEDELLKKIRLTQK